jgi:hypothetical protein
MVLLVLNSQLMFSPFSCHTVALSAVILVLHRMKNSQLMVAALTVLFGVSLVGCNAIMAASSSLNLACSLKQSSFQVSVFALLMLIVDNKPVWPTWAVGVLLGLRDIQTYNRGRPS